jgi:hypothetical protein
LSPPPDEGRLPPAPFVASVCGDTLNVVAAESFVPLRNLVRALGLVLVAGGFWGLAVFNDGLSVAWSAMEVTVGALMALGRSPRSQPRA